MKIWPQIQAKMALTQFSPIAGYYHGVLAATDIILDITQCPISYHCCAMSKKVKRKNEGTPNYSLWTLLTTKALHNYEL